MCVISARGVDQPEARRIIADAAHRAGQDELTVARELIRPYLGDDGPPPHDEPQDRRP